MRKPAPMSAGELDTPARRGATFRAHWESSWLFLSASREIRAGFRPQPLSRATFRERGARNAAKSEAKRRVKRRPPGRATEDGKRPRFRVLRSIIGLFCAQPCAPRPAVGGRERGRPRSGGRSEKRSAKNKTQNKRAPRKRSAARPRKNEKLRPSEKREEAGARVAPRAPPSATSEGARARSARGSTVRSPAAREWRRAGVRGRGSPRKLVPSLSCARVYGRVSARP